MHISNTVKDQIIETCILNEPLNILFFRRDDVIPVDADRVQRNPLCHKAVSSSMGQYS